MKAAVVLVLVALAEVTLESATPRTVDAQTTTSIEELRRFVDVLFAGDPARIEELIRFTQVPCVAERMGLDPSPECPPEGPSPGTLVDAFPVTGCQGRYFLPDELQQIVEDLATPGRQVVAAYRYQRQASEGEAIFHGDYVAVATIGHSSPPFDAGGIFIGDLGDPGITGVTYGCGQDLATFAEFWGLHEQIDLSAPSPAVAPTTGRGSSSPSAPVALAVALAAIAAAFVGAGLARRRS